ncbi:MAG: fibrobacter succinogenes major paralogous domain-containing protein [Bacteroidales bacterium]|nr:fibrobacter succinogenes major paralogous domain-containing protein [Bacteroidales bacterium]
MKLTKTIFSVVILSLLVIASSCKKEENITNITDPAGNSYKVVKINKTFWMAQNLKNQQGMALLNSTQLPGAWDANKACCCYYAGNSTFAAYKACGLLYNATAMKKNPCPEGWHVPSSAEWKEMVDFLGGASVAGGKLKDKDNNTYWNNNVGASNSTGFSAYGSGYCNNGTCNFYRQMGMFWTSDMKVYEVEASTTKVKNETGKAQNGYSIRCVKAVEKK